MTVKEIILSVENKPGKLSHIISHLYENDVKVPAFWVGTTKKKATLRFVTSDPKGAISVLTGLGFKIETMDVVAAQVPDHPGGLNTLLKLLQSANINILHIYPCLETQDTILILEVDKTEEAIKVLKSNWINLYDEKLYNL
ncbi:MAG: hypothetical protein JRJ42_09605 [Deltaproteobacteria bacterium]|nr:hypothetical protein [Deltaproteobacteria bacterium]MBW2020805.1 hypothetical protein [Deltaproteobacteria bacterium]MBW2075408.1 hypothetical protein [Deltaproteobacteria bacterium]RLB80086.1 MAG: hypothetical protein DRH17_12610 [Deltaproteobacteria bacterium]